MAHKLINGKAVVDWTTGDPEGDRLTVLSAYRDFLKEIKIIIENEIEEDVGWMITLLFEKWAIDFDSQIDNIPRVWIKRAE